MIRPPSNELRDVLGYVPTPPSDLPCSPLPLGGAGAPPANRPALRAARRAGYTDVTLNALSALGWRFWIVTGSFRRGALPYVQPGGWVTYSTLRTPAFVYRGPTPKPYLYGSRAVGLSVAGVFCTHIP